MDADAVWWELVRSIPSKYKNDEEEFIHWSRRSLRLAPRRMAWWMGWRGKKEIGRRGDQTEDIRNSEPQPI